MKKTVFTLVLFASLFVAQAQEIGGGGTVTTSTQRVKGQKGQTFTLKNGFVSYLNLGGGTILQAGLDFGYRLNKSELGIGANFSYEWIGMGEPAIPVYAYWKRNFGSWNWQPLIKLDLGYWALINGFYSNINLGVAYKDIFDLKLSLIMGSSSEYGYKSTYFVPAAAITFSVNIVSGLGKLFFPNKVQ